jgi:N6-adenosine-specific RNA methylase IME4
MGELAKIESFCELSKTNLTFKREVSKDEWMDVFKALKQVEGCVQFWIGDCLAYRQQKWGMYDDIVEETGMDKQYLRDIKYVADNVELSLRNDNLSFSHHREVASLAPEKQVEFLNKAVEEKLSVRELREEIKRDGIKSETPDLPKGKYSVIYADPAWPVGSIVMDKWISPIDDKYPTMSIEDIKRLSIKELTAEDCSLFLWTTHSFLPDALDIIKEWGFKYFFLIKWNKGNGWTQNGFHKMTEFLLFAYKGKMNVDQYGKAIPTLINENKTYHSKKPDSIRELIKSKTPEGRLELFAREKFDGWEAWGNEIKL